MRHNAQMVIRMSDQLAARVAALVPLVDDDPELGAAGKVTCSAVARLALARGLATLEQELAVYPWEKRQ